MFTKVESVQVLDGNILRDKQRVICRGYIRKHTLCCAKEGRFHLGGQRKYERLGGIPFTLPFTSVRDHFGRCTVNYKGTRMKTGRQTDKYNKRDK